MCLAAFVVILKSILQLKPLSLHSFGLVSRLEPKMSSCYVVKII